MKSNLKIGTCVQGEEEFIIWMFTVGGVAGALLQGSGRAGSDAPVLAGNL